MTILAQRQQLITLIDEATNAGARLSTACSEAGISHRTYRRWKADKNHLGDKRPIAVRPAPSNKLSDIERQAILDACNEPRFASLPPSQIVPTEPSRDCRRPKTLRQYPYKKQTIPNRS